MSGQLFAFFVLAIIAIAGGVLMLNVNKVIHMVMSLVATFLSIAGIYVLLSAEFVAVVQILIYSSAITIIMLFGIMLTQHHDTDQNKIGGVKLTFVGVGILAFFVTMYLAIHNLTLTSHPASFTRTTYNIGVSMYTHYIIPFEVASIILLVALVGAIVLARRDDEEEEVGQK